MDDQISIVKKYDTSFIGLDLLRFLLSVAVILFHYQHFYFPFRVAPESFSAGQPFFRILYPVYRHGGLAVPIFWIISGLIFFKFYYIPIESKAISLKKFMINRFSRLYPLHFLTLLIVLALQFYYNYVYKTDFVYQYNDLKHFILNIFFIQNWFNTEQSFNGPSWSVSIEIFVYIFFFIVSFLRVIKHVWLNIIIVLIFFTCFNLNWGLVQFNECLFCFFSGCLLCRIIDSGRYNIIKYVIITLTYLFISYVLKHYFTDSSTVATFLNLTELPRSVKLLLLYLCIIYAFISLFNSSLFKNVNPKFFAALGNLTYSMYLIHFPIQICFFLFLNPKNYAVFNSSATLLTFMATTILLGYITFYFFERPIQNKIRAVLSRK